jgi:hypothetical protein
MKKRGKDAPAVPSWSTVEFKAEIVEPSAGPERGPGRLCPGPARRAGRHRPAQNLIVQPEFGVVVNGAGAGHMSTRSPRWRDPAASPAAGRGPGATP